MFKSNARAVIPDDEFEGMTEEEANKRILNFND